MTGEHPLPRVVALVPAWNAAGFIDQTLESLAAQTYRNLEILISDDASPDSTADICERYAVRDDRFRVIRQPENLGWVGNVNHLIHAAEGEYLFFAFHDDLLAPDYVEKLAGALANHPEAVVAYSDMELSALDGSKRVYQYDRIATASGPVERARMIMSRKRAWWQTHRGLFRSDAARRIGGLRKHRGGEFAADWPWQVRLAIEGDFVRVPEVLCFKRMTGQSLSNTWSYAPLNWVFASMSCAREIRRARLPALTTIRLEFSLLIATLVSCADYCTFRIRQKLQRNATQRR